MMDIDRLRKADIFSGSLVIAVGLLVIWQSTKMPMQDSYGGVQNVWYVSPALFPLFVGCMLVVLGGGLMRTALRAVGLAGVRSSLAFLTSKELLVYLKQPDNMRYYGVVLNLLTFVFVLVPKVDFFLAAVLFLLALFCMYYCGDHRLMMRLLRWSLIFALMTVALLFTGLSGLVTVLGSRPGDWLVLMTIFVLGISSAVSLWHEREPRRRFFLSLTIALLAPFTIGIIFKYFLLVPMPSEGIVVQLLDMIWYQEF